MAAAYIHFFFELTAEWEICGLGGMGRVMQGLNCGFVMGSGVVDSGCFGWWLGFGLGGRVPRWRRLSWLDDDQIRN